MWTTKPPTSAHTSLTQPPASASNRLGELRDRTFDNQRHRASGLNLVASAIILWNTVYLSRAVDHLRHQGADVPDHLLAHVAPLGWEHVSLTGDYLGAISTSRANGSGRCAPQAQLAGLSVRF